MKSKLMVAAMLPLCAMAAGVAEGAAGRQHVVDSGFEDVDANGVAAGWESAKAPFRIARGEGFNGTTALKYENSDPKANAIASQKIPLRPGKRYLVQALIRTENLAGGNDGAGVSVTYHPGGAYSQPVRGTTADWVKVCFTSDIPASVSQDSIEVSAFVRGGCTGKAWFDELTVTDLERPPIGVLSSSAYRNRASKGTVAFIATLNLQTVDGWKADFTIKGANFSRTIAAEKMARDVAAVRMPVEELPIGESRVTFTLRDPSGGMAAEKSMPFVRFAGADTRKVHFDAQGHTIVDGKPFFPLCICVDPRDKDLFDDLKGTPFNCVLAGEVIEPVSFVRECERHGLKIIASVDKYYWGIGRKSIFASAEDAEKALRERVRDIKDSPALLAWYPSDEFPAHLAGVLEERRSLLERLDPDHPTYSATCHPWDSRLMFGAYEAVGSDPYPIGKNPDKHISQATSWAVAVRKGTFGVRPIWQIPQIFDWVAHWPELKTSRAPTEQEMRSMFWQAIASGANGLVCYAHMSLKWAEKRGHEPYAKTWAEVCRVAAEVERRMPMLLSQECHPRLKNLPEGLSARGWTKDGVRTVVLANQLRERLKGEILVDGDSLAFDLEPIGVEFREMKNK